MNTEVDRKTVGVLGIIIGIVLATVGLVGGNNTAGNISTAFGGLVAIGVVIGLVGAAMMTWSD